MKNLSHQEINSILKWSSVRVDAINRRLIPPAIILGFIALFVNTTVVQHLLNEVLKTAENFFTFTKMGLEGNIVFVLILLIVAIMAHISEENWKISATHNLIQEACSWINLQDDNNRSDMSPQRDKTIGSFGRLLLLIVFSIIFGFFLSDSKKRSL